MPPPEDDHLAGASVDLLLGQALGEDRAGRRPDWARNVCVAGMLLRTAAAFAHVGDPRLAPLRDFVLALQLPDGSVPVRNHVPASDDRCATRTL